MNVTTMHEVEEALREFDADTLREMAFQLARSHAEVCGLTSQVEGCAHISPDEMRDRVESHTHATLAGLLAPTAWLAIDLHDRLTG